MIRNEIDAGNSIESSHEYNQNRQAAFDRAVDVLGSTDYVPVAVGGAQ
jgi:hypothetical protein